MFDTEPFRHTERYKKPLARIKKDREGLVWLEKFVRLDSLISWI